MDYAALSPHVGSWALRDDVHGNSSLRGGAINWGNIGSRITSGLASTGRWLGNIGNRFIHSNTFSQIKQGIKDSGVIQNAANLAGETVNGLLDIGKLKLQQDLENLRRKALGEQQTSPAELAALIAALQSQIGGPPQSVPPPPPVHHEIPTTYPMHPPQHLRPTTRPIPEMVTEVKPLVEPPVTSSAPAVPATLDLPPPPPAKRPRKRPHYSSGNSWRARLNSMTGSGVHASRRRMCY
ncbi:pVI [Duck adenovirus 2]|nr:pVI [Duck adenovirus 2]